uniref:NADH-ubiquinone oxidoreductase chain 6 n=1 Tax=Rybaxis sp. 1 EF-2015 TaxID=1756864 RepID=A0A0S2M8E2_9COLE|nr:NADH deshydrogenase subunit 6 [Rybaxis sp. 1 EF-2015]
MTFLLMMNFMMSFMLIFMNHPLSMGLILMIQTLMITMISGLINMNFWFSYILFLIFIGGMLILFMYMVNIASNEMFKMSLIMMKASFIMMIFIMILMNLDFYLINMINFNLENLIINNKLNMFFNKYFNYPNLIIMVTMIMYLLLVLIASVKIINIKFGPIRQKM